MDVVSVWTVVDLKSQYLRRAPQERSVAEEAARDRERRLRELEGFYCVFLRESWIFDHSPFQTNPIRDALSHASVRCTSDIGSGASDLSRGDMAPGFS